MTEDEVVDMLRAGKRRVLILAGANRGRMGMIDTESRAEGLQGMLLVRVDGAWGVYPYKPEQLIPSGPIDVAFDTDLTREGGGPS